MLERIELNNFQCHTNLSLEFDQITTLVGASDSGKTAVLRALDWVCFNRGRTALLLRRGCKDMTVKLTVDGHTITRTTKQNSYWIDKQQLSTIGKTQPPEVVNIMRMVEENVQRQHDYLFWFACNGSGLIQQLNRIVDLTELDGWVKEGATRERKSKDQIDVYNCERSEIAGRCKELGDNRTADIELKTLEIFASKYEKTEEKYLALSKMLADLQDAEKAHNELNDYVKDLTVLLDTAQDVQTINDKLGKISSIVNKISEIDTLSKSLSGMLNDWKNIDRSWSEWEKDSTRVTNLSHLVSLASDFGEKESRCREYITDLSKLVDTAKELSDLSGRYTDLKAKLEGVRVTVPDMSPIKAVYEICVTSKERYIGLKGLSEKLTDAENEVSEQTEKVDAIKAEFDEKSEGICPICGGKLNKCSD